jgi:CRP/FNR family transcriptional regulator
MVTRLLRRFERAGWLTLGREQIELLDPAALRRVAEGAAVKD